jgi:hypothetical protein
MDITQLSPMLESTVAPTSVQSTDAKVIDIIHALVMANKVNKQTDPGGEAKVDPMSQLLNSMNSMGAMK